MMTTYINNGEIWADTVADKDAAKSFGSTVYTNSNVEIGTK